MGKWKIWQKKPENFIQPELKPEDVKDKIFDIITSLTRAKDVIDISYNSDFLHIYEAKQEKSATQLVKNLTRIAEETNNPTFVQQARAVERQVSQLKQAKEEAERENEVIKKEVAAISNKVKLITSENLFLRSDVTKDVQQLENLQHHITHTSNLISEIALQAIDAIKNNDLDLAIKKIDKLLIKNEEIATLSNFVSKAKFDTKVKKINGDIIAFINEYIVNVYSTINKKPIIEIDDYSKHYTMKFVPLEIIIIIENLLRNSIDAKADKVKITWDIGEHPILIYRDNGNGISDDILKHIFDYRFSTTGGGGLGMCHIKDIVQKMNGKIIVNNKLKKGVEFKISF